MTNTQYYRRYDTKMNFFVFNMTEIWSKNVTFSDGKGPLLYINPSNSGDVIFPKISCLSLHPENALIIIGAAHK